MIVVLGALLFAVDAGFGHSMLIRMMAARAGRSIEVKGNLHVQLLSRHPSVTAENVTIGNPPWTPAGLTAEIGRVNVIFTLPGSGEPSGIAQLAMQDATFHLIRDESGHANWQRTNPDQPRPRRHSWIIRSLSVPDAHVELADDFRHRQFAGTVSAQMGSSSAAAPPLRIDGTGRLNGRPVSFRLRGDPLATADHDHPYQFSFTERSSGSHLEGKGFLPQPFNLTLVESSFEATGKDLKDLYYLTGARLLDTGDYHLTGKLSRRGKLCEYHDLIASSGRSDARGTVSIDYSDIPRKVELNLNSQALYLSDLGVHASGRPSKPASPLLLSNTALSQQLLRGQNATVKYQAHTIEAGRVALHEVSLKARINHGVLTVMPLEAQMLGGRIEAHLKLDARTNVPEANVDLKIADLQLGQLPSKDPKAPLVDGPLQAQVAVTGSGRSLHEIAASANGTIKAQLTQGAVRASVAEMAAGMDLHALGLLLAHDKRDVAIRCATATLEAQNGTLTTKTLVADTDPALITGEGQIHMDTEALDLVIKGHGKQLRFFRWRAPVAIKGTLAHPSVEIQKADAVPLLVDRGRTKDANCTELVAESNSAGLPDMVSR